MGFFTFDQLHELWNFWEVRGIILFSLFLQSFLILVSPFRTKTANGIIYGLLWLAYLLADAAAIFAVGLIAHSQGESNSADKTIGDLLAFWAPILIIHLGGPDTITALALEDNELWQRHLLQLVSQLAATLYVLYKSLTRDSELLAPTILVLIVGIIKYGERVYSLYLASVNKFRDSFLTKPDPGLNYARYMKQYEHTVEEPETEFVLSDTDEDRSDIEMVEDGYKCYTKFKGLVADLIYSNDDWLETRKYFRKRNGEQAFRVVEIELNFLYEALYTKMPVIRTWVGYFFRFVCSVLVLVSFFLWYSIDKSHIPRHDVKITYALLGGAITLDVIAFFMLIFSDWPIANVMKGASGPEDESQQKNKKSTCRYKLKPLINRYLAVSDRRWSGYSKIDRTMLRKLLSQIFCFWRSNSAAQGDERTLPFTAMASRIFYRRWSESVQQFNLIDYSVNVRHAPVQKVCGWVGLTDLVDRVQHVSIRWFSDSLRDSIFSELKANSDTVKKPGDADKICKARGEWVLENNLSKVLKPWLTDVHYDESLILWHIATEICYHHDNRQNDQEASNENKDDESDLLHEENDIEKQRSHESVEEEDHVQPQRSQDQIEEEDDDDGKQRIVAKEEAVKQQKDLKTTPADEKKQVGGEDAWQQKHQGSWHEENEIEQQKGGPDFLRQENDIEQQKGPKTDQEEEEDGQQQKGTKTDLEEQDDAEKRPASLEKEDDVEQQLSSSKIQEYQDNAARQQEGDETMEEKKGHVIQQIVHKIVEMEEDIDAKRKKGPQSTSAANEKDDVERQQNNPAQGKVYKQKIDREVVKTLSDYMLYLLIMQPEIMTTVAGIVRFRFRITFADTCLEAKRFSKYIIVEEIGSSQRVRDRIQAEIKRRKQSHKLFTSSGINVIPYVSAEGISF